MVNLLYKESVYQIVEKIKNEPYFRWPNKMSGDVTRQNQSLYCSYHRDCRHTIVDRRTRKEHLRQLKKAGYLGEFLLRDGSRPQDQKGGFTSSTSTLARGLIRVTHIARKQAKIVKAPSRVLAPYKDALVVTLRIGGFDVKRVMVDQESGAKIMYPDLYDGLGLTPKDLMKYDSPLVAFDGSIVVPAG
ncbi:uncharacterized protein LOC142610972 [Castanea sativa]|uniref:uncharacterized protein LOC142610972 n=1 Tax=Castanea sativa TaxID=21020 RepID=UPI003F64BE27